MMGIRQEQKDLFSYNIDLDKRIRKENPLRKISVELGSYLDKRQIHFDSD